MAKSQEMHRARMFFGQLEHGKDLFDELKEFTTKHGVRMGLVFAIGAVQKACIGYYNQQKKEYQFQTIDKPMEITSLLGNISMKDDEAMVHAHVTLADEDGNVVGGHLAEGTIVFACEFTVQVIEGNLLRREHDETTGLSLWKM